MPHIYFIKSIKERENWVYIGSTNDLAKRLNQHNSGQVRSTQSRRPYELIYTEEYGNIKEARLREKEFKQNRSKKDDILKKLVSK